MSSSGAADALLSGISPKCTIADKKPAATNTNSANKRSSRNVSSKPIHPATLSSIAPTGCEFSTWAYLTSPRPSKECKHTYKHDSVNPKSKGDDGGEATIEATLAPLPNLVTVHANSLKIHVYDPICQTLLLAASYDKLAGTIVSLLTLENATGNNKNGKQGDANATSVCYDGLLLGFAGHPRLSIVYPHVASASIQSMDSTTHGGDYVWSGILTASSIIDLTPALLDKCHGSVSPLEQDLQCTLLSDSQVPTVAVVLGGGVTVAAFSLPRSNIMNGDENDGGGGTTCWWRTAAEPYFLPLDYLAVSLQALTSTTTRGESQSSKPYSKSNPNNPNNTTSATSNTSFSHGFGDILHTAFLPGYTEPVLVILHSNPHRHGGLAWSGRLGHHSSSTRTPTTLTAISISLHQERSVILWSLRDVLPSDSRQIFVLPRDKYSGEGARSGGGSSGGMYIMGVNQIVHVNRSGKLECAMSVNGFVRATGSAALLSKLVSASEQQDPLAAEVVVPSLMQPNPSPLFKLSIQLDACQISFVNERVAIVGLRNGSLYALELHGESQGSGASSTSNYSNTGGRRGDSVLMGLCPGSMCMSLAPLGTKVGGLGELATLTAWPVLSYSQAYLTTFLQTKKSSKNNVVKMEVSSSMDVEKQVLVEMDDSPSSLGLVFAGSRMGDSTLLMYNLKENVKLIPYETDEMKNKDCDDDTKGSLKRKREPVKSEKDSSMSSKDSKGTTEERQMNAKRTDILKSDSETHTREVSDDEDGNNQALSEEDILRQEEEELYAPIGSSCPNVIAPEEYDQPNRLQEESLLPGISAQQLYRPQIRNMSIFQDIKPLDSLTGLGPIGPGCLGPMARIKSDTVDLTPQSLINSTQNDATTHIYPCGYGSSGGLAILNSPGLNTESTIISEVDCRSIGAVFSCPESGYILLIKKENNVGCILMRLLQGMEENVADQTEKKTCSLTEIDVPQGTKLDGDMEVDSSLASFDSIHDVLTRMHILSVKEFPILHDGVIVHYIMLLVSFEGENALVIMSDSKEGELSIVYNNVVGGKHDKLNLGEVVSVATLEDLDSSSRNVNPPCVESFLACIWSSGHSSIIKITFSAEGWQLREAIISGGNMDRGIERSRNFYDSKKVVAIDLFEIADNIFTCKEEFTVKETNPDISQHVSGGDKNYIFDEDDLDLYGDEVMDGVEPLPDDASSMNIARRTDLPPTRYNTLGGYISGASLSEVKEKVIAISRQSGQLQLFDVSKLFSHSDSDSSIYELQETTLTHALLWEGNNCGHGDSSLNESSSSQTRKPKMHDVHAVEIRLFFCGASTAEQNGAAEANDISILKSFCLLVWTNLGDLQLYTASKDPMRNNVFFKRVSLCLASRPSKEEGRHRTKLKRKGIIKNESKKEFQFRWNCLHRFKSVTGQDGLFAATTRPLWFLSERGAPSVLCHRLRHAAPAGLGNLPVSGFCSNLKVNDVSKSGFLMVHDRIGRVGSQRMTLFNGLSDIFTKHGILPGGGISVQKMPLGVTVRQIQYISDTSISTPTHPLYAMLISKEVATDQSYLFDDGITAEVQAKLKEEKEKEKIKRQVEADLGGFDLEQEWVEEIEREDCFEIEKKYGGAPALETQKYEIWLVDASTWQAIDTYELDEAEYGITMKVMHLSEINPETTSEDNNTIPDESLFLVVGTGIIDKIGGEDIGSKGRILIFDFKRNTDDEIELNFINDKELQLGPVTSLNSLSCDLKKRLVVGAGAEITIEQWGNGKLTQVGFFHAYMHVQEVTIFKTFFLLSDAYNSLHFLVWRESDKSLTLLAKDYEPTCVYAAGLLTRGGALSFVCHDDRQNLSFFSYSPNDPAARGGNKLVCRADCHLGAQTVFFQSHLCRSSLLTNTATLKSTLVALKQQDSLFGKLDDDQRYALHFGTTDGGLGAIVPLNENTYWRLTALQSVMSNALESDCALSRRSWRLLRRSTRRGGCVSNDRKKGVIDGDLVMKYLDLSIVEQEDLASAIGSSVDLILDNLLELMCSSMAI